MSVEDGIARLLEDSDLAEIMESFEELKEVYFGSLEAMGVVRRQETTVVNTSNVTLSFSSPISSHNK